MKVNLEATEKSVSMHNVRCRVWRLTTEGGAEIEVAIAVLPIGRGRLCDALDGSEMLPAPLPPSAGQAHFSCPDCGAVSYNLTDIQYGYCGACHTVTRRETQQVGT